MNIQKSAYIIEGSRKRSMAADLHYAKSSEATHLVIYAHGINGFKDWGGMNHIAQKFTDAGFAFLKFNFSHNGTTPEHPEEFVDLEAYGNDNYSIRQEDLRKVIDFAASQNQFDFEVESLTLIGHSRGGTDAILYTGNDNRLNNLITWSAVSEATTPWRKWDPEKLWKWQKEGVQYLENSRTNQKLPVYYQLLENYKANKTRLNVENAARKINIPWLICHGTDDESVFIKDAYDLKEWQPSADTLIIENTGHTYGRSHPWPEQVLPKASEKLVDGCIKFLRRQAVSKDKLR